MSRVAKKPVDLPKGVEVTVAADRLSVKGPKGVVEVTRPAGTELNIEDGKALLSAPNGELKMAGTLRALLANAVFGVTKGFERKLELVGVGYRASMQGTDLNLTLGFSHPVLFKAPVGVTLAAPTQTEVLVSGVDKQKVGQAAAEIRAFRPPEPYKGKGVRYAGEKITLKEAKKA